MPYKDCEKKKRKESAYKHLASNDIKVLSITIKIRKLSSSKLLIYCIALVTNNEKWNHRFVSFQNS